MDNFTTIKQTINGCETLPRTTVAQLNKKREGIRVVKWMQKNSVIQAEGTTIEKELKFRRADTQSEIDQSNYKNYRNSVVLNYFHTSQSSSKCVLDKLAKAVAPRLPSCFLLFEFSVVKLVFAKWMVQLKLSYVIWGAID